MSNKNKVPDAWDDDWEAQADDLARNEQAQEEGPVPRSRAEHLAEHQEKNRKLWETAETPQTFHYLEANNNVPLASGFKPQVKVLSRKPMIAKRDPVTGISSLSIDDDLDDEAKEPRKTLEEARAKQKRDKEEKERRYEEARAKIFGETAPSSGASSPGATTPPRSTGRNTPQGRGRGRGGGNRGRGNGIMRQPPESRQQGKLPEITGRELYDPNYSPKPESSIRRQANGTSPALQPQDPAAPIRAPRGPDGSGRGGFGFTGRGTSKG